MIFVQSSGVLLSKPAAFFVRSQQPPILANRTNQHEAPARAAADGMFYIEGFPGDEHCHDIA
jgi:hypothetical protein